MRATRFYLVAIALCAVLVSCGLDDETVCTTGNDGPDACTGDTICINEECVSAFGRVYRITIGALQLPDTDPNGECWDGPICGPPDPLVVLFLNGNNILQTAARQDVFSATFDEHVDANIPAGSALQLDVWDEDIAEDDPAFSCVSDPLTADLVRGSSLGCDDGRGGNLSYTLVSR